MDFVFTPHLAHPVLALTAAECGPLVEVGEGGKGETPWCVGL